MAGDVAATAADFSITANGKIELSNQISAQTNIALTSTTNEATAIALTDSTLTAGKNLTLDANTRGITLVGGVLKANNQLTYNAGGLSDTGSTGAVSTSAKTDNNKRFSDDNVALNITGTITIGDVAYGAENNVAIAANNIAFTSAASHIYSDSGAVTVSADTGVRNTGTISAYEGSVGLMADNGITNSGTLYGQTSVSISGNNAAGRTDVFNSGTIFSDGALTIDAKTGTNTSIIQGATITTINATTLNNSGELTTLNLDGQSSTINTLVLTNSGTLQSAQSLDLIIQKSLDNSGTVLAGEVLSVRGSAAGRTLAVINHTGGVLQAGASFSLSGQGGSTHATLDNQSDSIVAADQLDLDVDSLNNSGTVQGAGGADLNIASTLTSNDGAALIFDTGPVRISADTIDNAGTIQAVSNLNVNVGSSLSNGDTGEILTLSALTNDILVRGINNTAYTIDNSGLMHAAGTLNLQGFGGTKATTIDNRASGSLRGNAIDIVASALTLEDASQLLSADGATIEVDTLTSGGSNAKMINLSGTSTVTVAGNDGFTNRGVVHSGGDLVLTARTIGNTSTAGISAMANLTATATGGDFINSGALFSGTMMNLSSTGTLHNDATGTMDSGNNITISAARFINNNYLNALQNISISAGEFRNETTGGDTRVWGPNTPVVKTLTSSREQGYTCNNPFDGVCYDQFSWGNYQDTWSRSQHYSVVAPKPQIVGGGTVQIRDFAYGRNYGGLISGNNVVLTGVGGATFVNDELALSRENYAETYRHEVRYIAAGGLRYYDDATAYVGVTSPLGDYAPPPQIPNPLFGTPVPQGAPPHQQFLPYHRGSSGTVLDSVDKIGGMGAGIFANGGNLTITGTALTNNGFLYSESGPVEPGSVLAGSAENANVGNTVNSTSNSDAGAPLAVAPSMSLSGRLSYADLNIALPSNPNGYFVASQNPTSDYLIETNALFLMDEGNTVDQEAVLDTELDTEQGGANINNSVETTFGVSNYLADRIGYDSEVLIKRLGDANYEAYLIRQQLIAKTGNNLLAGYSSQVNLLRSLTVQGADEAIRLGMTWGEAPTAAQLTALQQDIVWMLEVEVMGQTVLAPKVYLAQATRDAIETGAVIAGTNIDLSLKAMENTGGVITATDDLSITTVANITNTSGTISGGDVSLTSTGGSIINQTQISGSGSDEFYRSVTGNSASIASTGTMAMNAEKNIQVVGAEVSAGGDASLTAGNDITFETIVDKQTDTEHEYSGDWKWRNEKTTTTTTETNIGSRLQVGGSLTTDSGQDTALIGSAISIDGDLDVTTDGDFKVLSTQDKITVVSHEMTTGHGVGGGAIGTETIDTDDFEGKNQASNLDVGGSAVTSSDNDFVLQGSNINIAGDGNFDAENIQILDGLDETRTTVVRETQTFFKVGGSESAEANANANTAAGGHSATASADATASSQSEGNTRTGAQDSEAGSSSSAGGMGLNSAGADAGAVAKAESNHELMLSETINTTTTSGSSASVASQLNIGGSLRTKADDTFTLKGSDVAIAGDVVIEANNIEVLSGENTRWSTTDTERTMVGIVEESGAGAKSQADAEASAIGVSAQTGASGEASANTGSVITLGAKHSTDWESEESTQHRGGSITSTGGSVNLDANDTATFEGANVTAAENIDINATDIRNLAAKDESYRGTTSTSHTAGIYIEGKAGASASGNAQAGTGDMNATAKGKANADAEASIGVRYKHEESASNENTVTHQGNQFNAGGDFSRRADNEIIDQATQVNAGGDITQSARVITDQAVHDSVTIDSRSMSNDAKVGAYAGAYAKASGEANAQAGSAEADAKAGASLGIKINYQHANSEASSEEKTAVTSGFRAGGDINSSSKAATTLVGTNFESGGDTTIKAGSLDYQAAEDSQVSHSTEHEANLDIKIKIKGETGVKVDVDYGYEGSNNHSTTARTGGINAGGNLNIQTDDDASFEGTNLAGEQVAIDSGGKLDFTAARDTASTNSDKAKANLNIEAGSGSSSLKLGGGYDNSNSASDTVQVVAINSRQGGTQLSAGGDMTSEGTQLQSAGATGLTSGGDIALNAAESDRSQSSVDVSANINLSKGKLNAKGGFASAAEVTSTTTNIDSAQGITINATNIVDQEAELHGEQGGVDMNGNVETAEAKNNFSQTGFSGGFSLSADDKSEGDKGSSRRN
nr:hemagglutinin repeat-containing protein [Candidatus Marimicrobium litorale]